MELTYELQPAEIEESLLCLDFRREGKMKYLNVGVIGLVAGGCMIGYIRDNAQFFLMVFAAVAVALLFLLLYIPDFRRRRKARKMTREKGYYKVRIPENNILKGFESEHVFTIRTKTETYCVPKRILNQSQDERLRTILENSAEKMYRIETGRE